MGYLPYQLVSRISSINSMTLKPRLMDHANHVIFEFFCKKLWQDELYFGMLGAAVHSHLNMRQMAEVAKSRTFYLSIWLSSCASAPLAVESIRIHFFSNLDVGMLRHVTHARSSLKEPITS